MRSIVFKPKSDAIPYFNIPNSIFRVKITFRVDFINGGYLHGEDFLLDIDGDSISDERTAEIIVSSMNLLRSGTVTLLSKKIVRRGEHGDVGSPT